MAITTIYTYPLNGTQRDFTIPFEYLARRFVVLTLIGTDRKELVLTTDYRFTSKTNVQTNVPWGPADGYERIEIRRNTSATDRLVDFADGSILRASELNTSQVQTLHVAEEARNMVADTISTNQDGDLDARGRRLVNLADAVGPDHAVTLRQEQAWAQSTLGNRNAAEAAAVLSVASKEAAQSAQGVSTAQATLSTTKAAESEASAVRSETAAGTIGNNVVLSQQARAGAESARDLAVAAAQSVQGVNIPSSSGNGLKFLRQKADESGFQYVDVFTKTETQASLNTVNSKADATDASLNAFIGFFSSAIPINSRTVNLGAGTWFVWGNGIAGNSGAWNGSCFTYLVTGPTTLTVGNAGDSGRGFALRIK